MGIGIECSVDGGILHSSASGDDIEDGQD